MVGWQKQLKERRLRVEKEMDRKYAAEGKEFQDKQELKSREFLDKIKRFTDGDTQPTSIFPKYTILLQV